MCGFWRVVRGASGRLYSGWSLGAAGDWLVSEATEAMHASRERANDRRPGPSAGVGQREGLPEQRRLTRGQHTGKPREGDGPEGRRDMLCGGASAGVSSPDNFGAGQGRELEGLLDLTEAVSIRQRPSGG